jgi:peptidoglycan/xylan/chitin deacetylase (PgdA/CDA1 family)
MQYLRKSSFDVISLKEIATCIRENRSFPSRAVSITFDDGFKNVYDVAYPLLKEFGFQATVFLVPGYCGGNNRWAGQSRYAGFRFAQPKRIHTLDLLSWDEIVEMADNGIDFGAHTMTHPDLSKLPLEQAAEEIANSKSIIQKHLGKDVLFFAYPYGRRTEAIKSVVKDQFYGACSTELSFVTLQSDIYALPRIDMYYFSRNNLFTWLGTSIFSYYIKCRNILRSLRGWL